MKIRMPSLTTQIVTGLIAGILVGLFFGEMAAGLEVIGTVYVRLLQMTILPYIMFSLIVGFGSLSYDRAWLLAKRAGVVLLAFWLVGLSVVVLMATTFPDRQSATFFNPGMVSPAEPVSLVQMFVPSNPFEALATSAIPAVVLFSILFGLALIAVPKKEAVLDVFGVIAGTLQRVTGFVVKTTPLGVFGLTASAAGTLDGDDIIRLQAYFVTYISCCLFLSFAAFPVLMSMVTAFSYRQVLRVSKNALITAFTTGNLFVVLPILITDCQKMFKETCPEAENAKYYIDILVPVTFNFPNMGKLTALLFIFFGAWFIGDPLPYSHYPQTVATALPVFFGGIDIAVPYMLQIEGLPTDLFSLYVLSGIINGRFATLLACMELLCITLISVSSLVGQLRIQPRRMLLGLGAMSVAAGTMVLSISLFLDKVVPSANQQAEFAANMSVIKLMPDRVFESPPDLAKPPVDTALELEPGHDKPGLFARLFGVDEPDYGDAAPTDPSPKKLTRDQRILRVGFFSDNQPWSYFNEESNLVGYDVEAAHRLAHHLGCAILFYPLSPKDAHLYLDAGEIDLLMSGVPITAYDIRKYTFSDDYLRLHLALLFPDDPESKDRFSSIEKLKAFSGLSVGYVPPSPFIPNIRALLPTAELIEYDSYSDYFTDVETQEDASVEVLYTSAEAASLLSLLHPGYKLNVYPQHSGYNLAYAVNPNDPDFLVFLNQWLALERQSKAAEQSYNYWILGNPREDRAPRWSVVRDVLGWGKD
ncbi:cation:dicarboxylate symporter family transporter [Coraliomargarita parva]|uniref:cation:dicarboxylate symporter family transporter n=1 Tax=Coraliomargarita parva TaxID=3014050 RepID=UPI0022B491F9|nr:cation:dicarboxylase symporter family transporter [Coraliomargarita parva]